MGKTIYFTLGGLIIAAGLGIVIYFGLQPRSIPKINFSQFENPRGLGEATVHRLPLEIKQAPVLFVGVWPGKTDHIEAVRGFIDSLTKETDLHYDVVVIESRLEGFETWPGERINLSEEMPRFAEGVKAVLAQDKRVLVIAPTTFSSQLLAVNTPMRLKAEYGIESTSISLAPFPLARTQEKTFPLICETNNKDEAAMGVLGCAVIQKARTMYRKKKDPKKYSGAVDQVGLHDYLMLLAPPEAIAP